MNIPVWTIIVFISFVFLCEYAIYGADYYSEVFAEPPADNLAPTYLIAISEVPIKNSTYIRINAPNDINPAQYYGETFPTNTVETAIAYENIWSSGYWREATHPVYFLTPAEVEDLEINIDELPTFGKGSATPFPGAADWLTGAVSQITQILSLVWKLLSFDIPNIPVIFRTIICFPIWIGLSLSAFQLVRGA